MTVYSLNLNNKDFIHEIDYNNDADDLKLCTNDLAKNSMRIAIKTLEESIAKYFMLKEYAVDLIKINFAKANEHSTSLKVAVRSLSKEIYPLKKFTLNTSIAGLTEKYPTEEREKITSCIESLKYEVEKYLSGERAQGNLDI